jgi:hypothetical protein
VKYASRHHPAADKVGMLLLLNVIASVLILIPFALWVLRKDAVLPRFKNACGMVGCFLLACLTDQIFFGVLLAVLGIVYASNLREALKPEGDNS